MENLYETKILNIEELRRDLGDTSPLALPQKLIELEMYDMRSSQELLQEIAKEFDGGPGAKKALMEPIGLALCDGVIRSWDTAKKVGLTASQIYKEINNFTYENVESSESIPGNNTEPSLSKDFREKDDYKRNNVVSDKALNKYAEVKISEKRPVKDGYAAREEDIEDRNKKNWRSRHKMDVDHKVSAKNVHTQTSAFSYMPADEKNRNKLIKEIANIEDNLIITDLGLNRSKGEKHNFIYAIKRDNLEQTRKSLLVEGFKGQTAVSTKMAIGLTTTDFSKITNDPINTKQLSEAMDKVQNSGTGVVIANQVGKIITTIFAPLWFEIKDIAVNGITYGTDSEGAAGAIAFRLKRIYNYIIIRLPDLIASLFKDIWSMIVDLFKSVITSLFNKAYQVIKEGIGIIFQCFKILLAPSDKMSAAEKGDAILKLIGSLVPALLIDLGLSTWLKAQGCPPFVSDIAAGVASALVAAFLAYVLDKIDIFSVKSERRLARVREIFDARIAAIKESAMNVEVVSREIMREQRINFEKMRMNIDAAISSKDMVALNDAIDGVANFFQINIPYKNSEEFVLYIRENNKVAIGA